MSKGVSRHWARRCRQECIISAGGWPPSSDRTCIIHTMPHKHGCRQQPPQAPCHAPAALQRLWQHEASLHSHACNCRVLLTEGAWQLMCNDRSKETAGRRGGGGGGGGGGWRGARPGAPLVEGPHISGPYLPVACLNTQHLHPPHTAFAASSTLLQLSSMHIVLTQLPSLELQGMSYPHVTTQQLQ